MVDRYGMIDEASGYAPLYFGKTTNIQPHGIAGKEYVLYEDYVYLQRENAELRERLAASELAQEANHNLAVANGSRAREEHYRAETAERQLAERDAERARILAEELDDDQIMEIIKEVAPWKDEPKLNDLLTYEKSPPLFPQATYDAPSYRATNFVRAVERRIRGSLSAQPQPAQADGWRDMPAPSLERVIVAGWQPRNGNTSGYWWYQEDAVDDKGIPIGCPQATLWVRLLDVLPAFPAVPTPAPAEGW